ncbi:hypothetical protein JWG39_04555 [Desulforhopalus vacuolatus]|uniref:hypothetical protein n=1 Tax=Desulforhopalus vacuolatus TaxID=40414 RepID=UPI0019651964|nr:hypothetical protein [Desulforhopalus vacuolatus]MBM9519087.1 hypothetical protein [Desulforhopalus vacuolatus]
MACIISRIIVDDYHFADCRHRRDKACLVYTTTLWETTAVPIFYQWSVNPPLLPHGDSMACIISRIIGDDYHFADCRHRRDKACLVYTTTSREITTVPIFRQRFIIPPLSPMRSIYILFIPS